MSITLEELKEMASKAFEDYPWEVTSDPELGKVIVVLDDLMGRCMSDLHYRFEDRFGFGKPSQRLEWYCTGTGGCRLVLVLQIKEA